MNVELPKTVPDNFREITVRTEQRTLSITRSRLQSSSIFFDASFIFFVKVNGRAIEATERWDRACEVFRRELSRSPFLFFSRIQPAAVAAREG